ncbi:hypothetical protein F0562_032589 [Nyssa sinensis]|uniref:Uncharacterized protein n=1 Tax=Nyssa sinensis TaxID=561372 RepID=A0A5J5AN95_9ASTE|nr:hypothetical protein F0562_032589 [Nyssa sinensis]
MKPQSNGGLTNSKSPDNHQRPDKGKGKKIGGLCVQKTLKPSGRCYEENGIVISQGGVEDKSLNDTSGENKDTEPKRAEPPENTCKGNKILIDNGDVQAETSTDESSDQGDEKSNISASPVKSNKGKGICNCSFINGSGNERSPGKNISIPNIDSSEQVGSSGNGDSRTVTENRIEQTESFGHQEEINHQVFEHYGYGETQNMEDEMGGLDHLENICNWMQTGAYYKPPNNLQCSSHGSGQPRWKGVSSLAVRSGFEGSEGTLVNF